MRLSPQDIQRRLAQLRAADPARKRFGAATHRYLLNPPLSEGEVLAIEKRLGVRLSKEYRTFVTQVGDGGAGPVYGVYPLAQVESELLGCRGERAFDPGRPFARPTSAQEARETGEYPTHGILPLAEIGCGMFYVLVSAGPERGTMWWFGNDNAYLPVSPKNPTYPQGATGEETLRIYEEYDNALLSPENRVRLTFWDWYRRWLGQPSE